MAATTARTSATVGQEGMSNLQGFQAHHPPTYMGEGDSMVKITIKPMKSGKTVIFRNSPGGKARNFLDVE